MARGVAGLPTHSQGPLRHPAEEQEERDGTAPPARGADEALAGQLQKGHDGAYSVSRHVRIGAMVEGWPYPGHHRPGKRVTAPGNREARATTGSFRTSNLGAPSMESGPRAATAQLENRQRRFGLRLLSLPQGDQARELVGAPTAIVRRLVNALAYAGRTESTVLLEEPETLDAELLQEAYDVECAALARALESASRRQTTPERVIIFTDAQAAIRRMVSEEPGPSQKYALQARKHIAMLRKARPDIVIEIRWRPAHKGVPGNEKADEAKPAAGELRGRMA